MRGPLKHGRSAASVQADFCLNPLALAKGREFDRSGFWDVLARWRLLLVAILACVLLALPTAAAEATAKNVLILFRFFNPHESFTGTMESSVRAHFSGPVSFTLAYLENPRFEEESYQNSMAESFNKSYGRDKPDVVVAIDYSTLEFLEHYRRRIFHGLPVPIVFVGVASNWLEGRQIGPGVTGVAYPVGVRGTLDLALHLHPDANAVAVITDTSEWERYWLAVIQSELRRYHDKVAEIDLIGPPSKELLERVNALPSHTIVFFNLASRLSTNPEVTTFDVLAAASKRVPTYSLLGSNGLGQGSIGGAFYDEKKEALLTGEAVSRVLAGERPENIPVVYDSPQVQVDWRQLRRWHIPESALPPGSVVLYREPTLWERDRRYFLPGIAVIVLQASLILGLLWQRARRRRSEVELRRSEGKFSKVFRQSPLAKAIARASDGCYIEVNEAFERQTGWKQEEVIGRSPLDLGIWMDPDQRVKFLKELAMKGKVRDMEVRFRRKDGQIRTGLGSAELLEVDGIPCVLSVDADITERKMTEEALATLSGRLIETQEEERKRIAREIHDDYQQRLAMVAMDLEGLSESVGGHSAEAAQTLHQLFDQVSELGADLHSLSHRLHSSTLESLGLIAGVRAFCEEFSLQQEMEVEFVHENVPRFISKDAALCLFRIVQESLRNVKRHSGVQRAEVRLELVEEKLHLSVTDRGRGFNANKPAEEKGIGVRSMEERLRLLGGKLEIESKPMEGTRIDAWLPFKVSSECRS